MKGSFRISLRHQVLALSFSYLFLAGLLKVRGQPFGWEVQLVKFLEPLRQDAEAVWLQLLSAPGGLVFISILTLATAAFFISRRQLRPAILAIAFTVLVYSTTTITKLLVSYARPEFTGLTSAGFPSLHAALSLAPVLFVLLYTRSLSTHWKWQGIIWLVPLLVGLARVASGAHYPLDVAGGWLLGLVAMIGLLSVRKS